MENIEIEPSDQLQFDVYRSQITASFIIKNGSLKKKLFKITCNQPNNYFIFPDYGMIYAQDKKMIKIYHKSTNSVLSKINLSKINESINDTFQLIVLDFNNENFEIMNSQERLQLVQSVKQLNVSFRNLSNTIQNQTYFKEQKQIQSMQLETASHLIQQKQVQSYPLHNEISKLIQDQNQEQTFIQGNGSAVLHFIQKNQREKQAKINQSKENLNNQLQDNQRQIVVTQNEIEQLKQKIKKAKFLQQMGTIKEQKNILQNNVELWIVLVISIFSMILGASLVNR